MSRPPQPTSSLCAPFVSVSGQRSLLHQHLCTGGRGDGRNHRMPYRSAGAEQMLERELVEANEAEALAAEVGVGVEVLVSAAIGEQVVVGLTR